jgi:predicted aspartyl protease
MGLTYIAVANAKRPGRQKKTRFLIDSGAVYSVVPSSVLKSLGIAAHSKTTFTLANGESIERGVGYALFKYRGKVAPSTVIFGEPGDNALLGVVTLEELGCVFDPLRRELKPLPMLLA